MGLERLIEAIPVMNGLQSLSIDDGRYGSGYVSGLATAILNALEGNTTLQHFEHRGFGLSNVTGFEERVEWLMTLNRAGRRILGTENVADSIWPLILAKSSKKPDAIHYFLHEKPQLVAH